MNPTSPATRGPRARRTALGLAALVLSAATMTACGGSDGGGSSADAPKDANKDDFCSAYGGFLKDISGTDASKIDVKKIKKSAEGLVDLGTPSDTPKDARAGFESSLKIITDLPDDADEGDLEDANSKFSDADEKNSQAFGAYIAKTCPDVASQLG